ncbi:iron chaperone frataxin [Gottschalkiaceae bacterium SANA]|nr:iron chaperone frataxin [Gottschalkiaceae bacterium SANA]
MEEFAEYLARIDDLQHRDRMEEVLIWVHETFPTLQPRIAWNQPMFTDHGTFIIGFSVSKLHLAVAPEEITINHFAGEMAKAGYDHTKQLMRIKWKDPVDYSLLERIIIFNMTDKADYSTFWRKK